MNHGHLIDSLRDCTILHVPYCDNKNNDDAKKKLQTKTYTMRVLLLSLKFN